MAPAFLIADDLAVGQAAQLLPNYKPLAFAINAFYAHRYHLSNKLRRFTDLIA